MSFILDALKKSETDRQQRSSAEFSKVPTSGGPARAPGWLLILGVLLAINLVVLLGLFLKPGSEPANSPSAALIETGTLAANDASAVPTERVGSDQGSPSFASRVAEVQRSRPATTDNNSIVAAATEPETAAVLPVLRNDTARDTASLPTIYEVIADGSVVLPELHLDIHVYSEARQDRFVFINMSKQREKSQLSEGPLVEEITPDGVILSYRGTSFLLPRD